MSPNTHRLEEHRITKKPYYLETGNELEIALSAHKNKLPLLLIGPTGCGKTRFFATPGNSEWKFGTVYLIDTYTVPGTPPCPRNSPGTPGTLARNSLSPELPGTRRCLLD